ncbi:ATP synthase [Nesidiocoris tenuis]|uniref:Oligomycin sensitivity conferral protein n=1 Tax=Nesidiocoris tenuis TaxID=355587 RepID=A0ABN7B8F8_9HEMI|nr:ATP synthase [Nesidiocoris tenuis]
MASTQITSAVRSFSSSAAASQLVKPPVQVFGVEGRYASALYSAATKLKQLDAVEKDLDTMKAALKTDAKLREFVVNPSIKRSVKADAIKAVAGKIKLSAPSANLLGLLAENGRLNKLDGVVAAFSTIMAGHRGDLRCEVTTAKALDDATKTQVQTVLKAFAKKGENILVTHKVDPALIGGMIVSIGDKYVDMSVSSKIKKYTSLIQQSV